MVPVMGHHLPLYLVNGVISIIREITYSIHRLILEKPEGYFLLEGSGAVIRSFCQQPP